MAYLVPITDPRDERLADYAALTDAALRKRYEREHGVLIAEGPNPVAELVTSPYPLRSVLVTPRRAEEVLPRLVEHDVPVYVASRELLYEVVRFKLHQGIIACGGRLPPSDARALLTSSRRLVVFEGLNDHENLGSLFRSARAFGIDAAILGPGCADPLYRRAVRVSMGHVLKVPHARLDDLDTLFGLLRSHGFTTLATTPSPEANRLTEVTVSPQDRVAVLLGAEGPGLSDRARTAADLQVRIPMVGQLDSLNVASAGAIVFHWLATPEARVG